MATHVPVRSTDPTITAVNPITMSSTTDRLANMTRLAGDAEEGGHERRVKSAGAGADRPARNRPVTA